jgi:hypothetical protein
MQDDTAKNAAGQPAPTISIRKKPLDGFCLSSLIMGIIGLAAYILLAPSILAIVFGIEGLRRTTNPKATARVGRWMAISGMVCGSIELLLATAVSIGLF